MSERPVLPRRSCPPFHGPSRFLALALPLAFALLLPACGGGGSAAASPGEAIAELEARGELPVLDRSASLAGPDANADGVRDDIARHIEARYPEPARRRAVMQMARAFQRMLLVDRTDEAALDAVSLASTRAIVCAIAVFTEPDSGVVLHRMMGELRAMSTNTKARLLAYLAYNKARSGSVTQKPQGDTCE